jgi:hypothetical protein
VSVTNGRSPFARSPDNLSAAGLYYGGVVRESVCEVGPGFAGGVSVIFDYLWSWYSKIPGFNKPHKRAYVLAGLSGYLT